MNFVHLYKHLCSKSVWKSVNSNERVIRPFIKAPAPITTNIANFKRLCATTKSTTPQSEEEYEEVEYPSLFGKSENRVPPDLIDKLEMEEILKEVDEWIEELDEAIGGVRVPYTVDMRDQIKVNTTLDVGRHCRVTAGGRIFTYSALVLLGTGNGTAGIGYGKGDEVGDAVTKATMDAQKRMISISRWHQKLPHTIVSKYRGTEVIMKSRALGAGVSGHPTLQLVAEAFGLEDMTCKTYRSRNTRKIVAAMVYGILKNANLHPASKAKAFGRKFVSWEDYWKPPPPNPPARVRKDWSTTAEPTDRERNENLEALATVPGVDLYNFAREYGIDLGYKETVLSNLEIDTSIADKDAGILEQIKQEEKIAEEEYRLEKARLEREEMGEEEQEEEEEEAYFEEQEEEAVEEEEQYEEEEEEATDDRYVEPEEPDFPGAYPEKPLVEKTLEERIHRETKIAPLKK